MKGEAPRAPRPPLDPPASMVATTWPALARVAQRLGMSLADVDRRLTVADVLQELDLQRYLYDLDVDDPPFLGVAAGRSSASAAHRR